MSFPWVSVISHWTICSYTPSDLLVLGDHLHYRPVPLCLGSALSGNPDSSLLGSHPLTTLCCTQFSSTHHLSSGMWAEISPLLSKSCSLPPAHLSSRCLLCSSSSMTHDMAFYCYHCNLLLFPNPQPAFPSLLVTTQVLPAVSSRADVGPCHPKANPPGSSSIAQAAH